MINSNKVYGVRFLIFGLLINLFTGLFVSVAGQNSHSIRDALELSFKNDKQLIIARQGVNIQKEIITEARSGANPSFSGLLSTKRDWAFDMESSSDNVSGSVLGSYTIYDSLLTQNKIKLELLTLKVLQSDLKQLEQTILFSTINAFLNVQRDKKFVELSEGNVTVLGKKFQEVIDRFDLGEVTRTDVAQAESALASAKANLTARIGSLNVSRELYYSRTGVYPTKILNLKKIPTLPKTQASAISKAVLKSPKIISGFRKLEKARLMLALAKSNKGPKVQLRSTLSSGYAEGSGDFNSARLAIEATFPIFNGALDSKVRQAASSLTLESVRLDRLKRAVAETVAVSWSDLSVARSTIEARRRQVDASEIAYNGIVVEEKLGARTTFDVINAEQDLLEARNQLATAERDEIAAVYSVLAAMGKLDSTTLNLRISESEISEKNTGEQIKQLSPMQKLYNLIKKRY